MTIDEALAEVEVRRAGRTRFEGARPWLDETLADEVTRLRSLLADCQTRASARLNRIIVLKLERDELMNALDKADAKKAREIAEKYKTET